MSFVSVVAPNSVELVDGAFRRDQQIPTKGALTISQALTLSVATKDSAVHQRTWGRPLSTGDHDEPLKAISPTANIALADALKGSDGKFVYCSLGPVASSRTFSKKLAGDRLDRDLEPETGNVKNFPPFAALLVPSVVTQQTMRLETIQNQWSADVITGTESMDQYGAFINRWGPRAARSVPRRPTRVIRNAPPSVSGSRRRSTSRAGGRGGSSLPPDDGTRTGKGEK